MSLFINGKFDLIRLSLVGDSSDDSVYAGNSHDASQMGDDTSECGMTDSV